MKTMQKLLFYAAVILITSCSEEPDKMLTVINPDGSCRREFFAYADSAFMLGDTADKNNPFPVEIDSLYSIVWQYKDGEIRTDFPISKVLYDSLLLGNVVVSDTIHTEQEKKEEVTKHPISQSAIQTVVMLSSDTNKKTSNKGKDFLVFASRNFNSVEQMSKEFKLKSSHPWKDMDIEYNFGKKFRFFYTYFFYQETYPQIEIPFEEPIENFMTKEEADFWFIGEPNLVKGMNGLEMADYLSSLNEKYEIWYRKNEWNTAYKTVVENYNRIKNPPVPKEDFINLRDTIFEVYFKSKQQNWMINISEFALNDYFKTKVFSEFWKEENDFIKKAHEGLEDQDFMAFFENSFAYQLIMPGKILSTNGVNRNDTLNWNLTAYRMAIGDYTIEAQSRKLNIWMIVLTGVLAITTIVIFVYRRKQS